MARSARTGVPRPLQSVPMEITAISYGDALLGTSVAIAVGTGAGLAVASLAVSGGVQSE